MPEFESNIRTHGGSAPATLATDMEAAGRASWVKSQRLGELPPPNARAWQVISKKSVRHEPEDPSWEVPCSDDDLWIC